MRILVYLALLPVFLLSSVQAQKPLFEKGDALGITGEYGERVYFLSQPRPEGEILDTFEIQNNNEFLFWGRDPKIVNGYVKVCIKGPYRICIDGWVEAQFIVTRPIPTRYLAQYYDTSDLKLLVKYWEQDPDTQTLDTYAYVLFALAKESLDNDDYKNSIYYATKSLKALPTKSTYMVRAIAKHMLLDYRGCITDCEKGELLKSRDLPFINSRCSMYLASNLFEHRTLNFSILKGASNFELGKYQSALTNLDKGIKEMPESGTAHYYRGLTKLKLSMKDDGCKDLSRAGELGIDVYQKIAEGCN